MLLDITMVQISNAIPVLTKFRFPHWTFYGLSRTMLKFSVPIFYAVTVYAALLVKYVQDVTKVYNFSPCRFATMDFTIAIPILMTLSSFGPKAFGASLLQTWSHRLPRPHAHPHADVPGATVFRPPTAVAAT